MDRKLGWPADRIGHATPTACSRPAESPATQGYGCRKDRESLEVRWPALTRPLVARINNHF